LLLNKLVLCKAIPGLFQFGTVLSCLVLSYLFPYYRRNELLLANKPTIVRQAAATAGPEEEKIKKFATAIIEFSKVKKKTNG